MTDHPTAKYFVVVWLNQPEVCQCVLGSSFLPFTGPVVILFSLAEHRSKAMATEAASVSLNMLTCTECRAT
jgi:hypothetical protein